MEHRSIYVSRAQSFQASGPQTSPSASLCGRLKTWGGSLLLAGWGFLGASACHIEPDRPELDGEIEEVSFQLPSINQLLIVSVFTPTGYSPDAEDPLPVAYVLGDNENFEIAAEYASGLEKPVLVVGLGYGRETNRQRPFCGEGEYRDYTPQPGSAHNTECAGGKADGFFRFLKDTVLPTIDAEYGGDSSRRTLIGHDLGALFISHISFAHGMTEGFPFRMMVAGDTPFGFDDAAILRRERRLFDQQIARRLPIGLRLVHGGLSDPAHYAYFLEIDGRLKNSPYADFDYRSELIEDADDLDMHYITLDKGVSVASNL